MSKINAIRLINTNYNHNGIRVDDETFHLNGESTLLTLRNGGGKSVLVQMLMSPFVHKRYRDIKDRRFSSYFTTNKPSFILIEWKLDGGSGYVMTGMMVRKSQEIREEQTRNDLDIVQFIHEYKEQNPYDIQNIPFIKTDKDMKTLKTYSESRTLLESLKTSNEYRFSSYDMNNSVQARNYYTKLVEYQIYHKEWQSIIRKINLKESGLSELFTNAKDEAGLIDSWFLPTIEDKLNKDKNRIDEFRDILGKYIKQYKDNKSKIDQKNIISLFKEETGPVLDIGSNLQAKAVEKSNLENDIANLILSLKKYRDSLDSERMVLDEKEIELNNEIYRIEYEELSYVIYGLKDLCSCLEDDYDNISSLMGQKEEEKISLIKDKNIQDCAKIYQQYRDASLERQVLENKYELIKDKEKDRTPEREALGYTLRNHYEQELGGIETLISNIQEEIRKIEDRNRILENESENLKNKEITENSRLSKIKANISNYSRVENSFNKLYKEDLRRNILARYEEGSLEIRIKSLKELIEGTNLKVIRSKKETIEKDEKLKSISRHIQDKTREHARLSQKIIGSQEKLEDLEAKIETRKSIIKHINFSEDRIFDNEGILLEFNRRKDEVREDIKRIEGKKRDLEEEYKKLKSGKVLELPPEVKEALEVLGINYVYGMEWLKRNNKSFSDNSKIVKNNPFIPYGLILTSRDIERLKENNLGVYTSFPIPIIKRENIEKNFEDDYGIDLKDKESNLEIGKKVNFYVLFNDNLLDEEELSSILAVKQDEIDSVQDSLDIRTADFSQYEEKYNVIFYQGLSNKDYNETQKSLQTLIKTSDSISHELEFLRQDEERLRLESQKLSENINKMEKVLDESIRKDKALSELYTDYKEYLNLMHERIEIEDYISKIKAESIAIKEKSVKLRQIHSSMQESRLDYISKQKNINEKVQEYLRYDERELIDKDMEDVEARYLALTKEITGELKDVEESLAKASHTFDNLEKELIYTSNRLKINEEEYINGKYDTFIVESIEHDIAHLENDIKELVNQSSDLKSKIAVKYNEIATEMKKLKETLGKEELLPKRDIVLTDFRKRIRERQEELKMVKSGTKQVLKRIGYCDNNLSSLAEYYELRVVKEVELPEDIRLMDKDTLDRFRGMLVRDYRNVLEDINNIRGVLRASLDKLLRNKAFQEDFFSRPLNTLYSLIEEPNEFISQLMTTIKAYDDLMAKIEVDIALIDKERERIIQILLEYISDIHKNLGKIDKNSSIKIGDKPIKMLRIELTDWEKEENIYQTRLEDMIEDLTKSGINRLENNENIEEAISPLITTTNLYNTVVGISNIRIRLYKIEAHRQYQIDWADVSRNSGGEGFISAFVILSSLLSFMRRDDTDIFAELEEGKVLVMDNPFAQTNAAHLLGPLMDVAKKSNTQLIAFTGLSGEAIYNSFDNIYVLDLIPSKLKKGMQYLKTQHAKGKEMERETMISSQIRTEEMEQLNIWGQTH